MLSPDSEISQFLNCQPDVSNTGRDPEYKKNNRQPGPGFKFHIKVSADAISDEDRQRDLQAQAAEIG